MAEGKGVMFLALHTLIYAYLRSIEIFGTVILQTYKARNDNHDHKIGEYHKVLAF